MECGGSDRGFASNPRTPEALLLCVFLGSWERRAHKPGIVCWITTHGTQMTELVHPRWGLTRARVHPRPAKCARWPAVDSRCRKKYSWDYNYPGECSLNCQPTETGAKYRNSLCFTPLSTFVYAITVVPIFLLCPPPPSLPTLLHCPCPWAMHIRSLANPFTFFCPVLPSPIPCYSCRSVP